MKEIQGQICNAIQNGVENIEIISTIDLLASHLNAETVANFGKRHGKDYTGAKYLITKNKLKTFELFGVKFVIDND